MTLSLSDDARRKSIASIKRYFAEELELDIGDLKAGLVLEFFLKEIGPSVHNAAIGDAQAFLRDRLEDIEGVVGVQEFGYWKGPGVKRRGGA